MDIIFLSYDEPNADENWQILKKRFPQSKRIHGIKGHLKVKQECAHMAETDFFFQVDGDSVILDSFNFSVPPNVSNDTTYIWKSKNPVNGLEYGHGGIKLIPKKYFTEIKGDHLDNFLNEKIELINTVASISAFNTSPLHAWRTAFRESVKLSQGMLQYSLLSDTERANGLAHVLDIWCRKGSDQPFGNWCLHGAQSGKEFGLLTVYDEEMIKKINDYEWLEQEFRIERIIHNDRDPVYENESIKKTSEQYSNIALRFTKIDNNKIRCYNTLSKLNTIINHDKTEFLTFCSSFESVQEHAKQYTIFQNWHRLSYFSKKKSFINFLPGLSRLALEEGLEIPLRSKNVRLNAAEIDKAIQTGYFASKTFIKKKIMRQAIRKRAEKSECTPKRIQAIGIPTKDRPDLLKRCVQSYGRNIQKFSKSVLFNVVDDSSDPKSISENLQNLKRLKHELGVSIHVTTAGDKVEFIKSLERYSHIPLDVLSFCLLGEQNSNVNYGAARNTLQLLSIDELQIQVDDDTLCDCVCTLDGTNSITFSALPSWEVEFFESQHKLLNRLLIVDVDFVNIHEQVLGKKPLELNFFQHKTSQMELDVEEIDMATLGKFEKNDAKILVSCVGAYGDPGQTTGIQRLNLRGESFKRLVSNQDAYDINLCTRNIMSSVTKTVVSNVSSFLTLNIGLDNSNFIIPFMPTGRNEDYLFSQLISKCFKNSLLCVQPFGVFHDTFPTRPPYNKIQMLDLPSPWGCNDFIGALLRSAQFYKDDVYENCVDIGKFLRSLLKESTQDFQIMLTEYYCANIIGQLQNMQELAALKKVKPRYWLNDVNKYIDTLEKTLTDPIQYVLSDVPGDLSSRIHAAQLKIEKFANLLTHWPDIVSAARDLKKKGITLGKNI